VKYLVGALLIAWIATLAWHIGYQVEMMTGHDPCARQENNDE